jgi:beta-galactosidase
MYKDFRERSQEWIMYASESASTVSSRGEYFFPAVERKHFSREEEYHSSSYDLEFPRWASSPDREFMAQDSCPWMLGEFVWTGIDYLGEPTPYNTEWPSRSSYFGMIDLAGIPKDRFYLYQSRWTDREVLHLLPHWNWEGREGESIPVHCYTNFERAELFVNGKSMGIREPDPGQLYRKYRLVWDSVPYEAGELKICALDEDGNILKTTSIMTAGEPAALELKADRQVLKASGEDLAYVTVRVIDKDGNLCPEADNTVEFSVTGNGTLRAVDDGDPTSLESFQASERSVFNGQAMAIVQSTGEPGEMILRASSVDLEGAEVRIEIKGTDAIN